ncbi:phage tail assembly chaperone [Croceicoccus bisphenolivorans]|uniref:phage tail assembly chaperone n=1 Tax=Croceicoccus bisphenolivorans TaxID=1783232 RepID=UPI0008356D37|nr:phage tail assembly chaperone [Croceicoccus bisphenolivorans]
MTPKYQRFADSAARLSGQCALMLGWRPDEFWAATPAEVSAIIEAANGPRQASGISRSELTQLLEQDNG